MSIALFGLLVIAAPTVAGPINHGNFPGTDVTYTDVTEASTSGDATPPFGAPTPSGNSLVLTPDAFVATASGASDVDMIGGTLTFGVVANPGQTIDNIKITEVGDAFLSGTGNDNTLAKVTGHIVLSVHEVDGVGIDVFSTLPIPLSYSPSGGTFGLGTNGNGEPPWMGMAFLDVEQILIDNNIPFTTGATSVSANLTNTLVAVSQDGTAAGIAKHEITVSTNIPEPTTCALALLGMVASLLVARRSR